MIEDPAKSRPDEPKVCIQSETKDLGRQPMIYVFRSKAKSKDNRRQISQLRNGGMLKTNLSVFFFSSSLQWNE